MINELDYEPEECDPCRKLAEDGGFEYEFNYTVEDGIAYCDHCRTPL